MSPQEKGAEEDFERELSFQPEGAAKKPIGGGTKTLAQRLSQSLRDPLRSKDYCGTVDKGEITIDCHHHSKVVMFKNRKGYLSPSAMENLTGVLPLPDCPPGRGVGLTGCQIRPALRGACVPWPGQRACPWAGRPFLFRSARGRVQRR